MLCVFSAGAVRQFPDSACFESPAMDEYQNRMILRLFLCDYVHRHRRFSELKLLIAAEFLVVKRVRTR